MHRAGDNATKGNFVEDGMFAFTAAGDFARKASLKLSEECSFAEEGNFPTKGDLAREGELTKDSKFAVEGNFDHALEILGESVCTKPFCPLRERVATSLSAQTSQGMSCPLHSVFTNRGMSPPPQPKEVEQPLGVPPLSWSTDPITNRAPDIKSVEQQPTARVTLPAKAQEETIERQQSSRKRSAVSQLRKTGAITIKSMQSKSSRKCSAASQSMKTRVLTVSMQSRSSRNCSAASQSETRVMTGKSMQSRSSRKRSMAS